MKVVSRGIFAALVLAGCSTTQGPSPADARAKLPELVTAFACDFIVTEDILTALPAWPNSGQAFFRDLTIGLHDFGLSSITLRLEKELQADTGLKVCGFRSRRSSQSGELELQFCPVAKPSEVVHRVEYVVQPDRGFSVRSQGRELACSADLEKAILESIALSAVQLDDGRTAVVSEEDAKPSLTSALLKLKSYLVAPDPESPVEPKRRLPNGRVEAAPHWRGARVLRVPLHTPADRKSVDAELRVFGFREAETDREIALQGAEVGGRLGILVPVHSRESRLGTVSVGLSTDTRGDLGADVGLNFWLERTPRGSLESQFLSTDGRWNIRTRRYPDGSIFREWAFLSESPREWVRVEGRRLY